MRNCTTKLTSLNVVSPSTSRNVVRIETAAMSSGTRARKDAKTKSSTTSAPRAPNIVSARTLGPSLLLLPADSRPYDVTPVVNPLPCAAFSSAAPQLGLRPGREGRRLRPLHQGERRAVVVRDEGRVAGAGQVDQPDLREDRAGARLKTLAIWSLFASTVWPSGTVTTATKVS